MKNFIILLCLISVFTVSYAKDSKANIKDIKVFSLKKRSAEELEKSLSDFVSDTGRLSVDAATNSIIMHDYPENISAVSEILKSIDTEVSIQQVLIEAVIVETNTLNNQDLGISWEVRKDLRPSEAKNVQSSIANDLPFNLENGSRINIGTLNTDDFNILLQYLKSKTGTNILSSPRITIFNNESAKIMVGNKIPYVESVTAENIVNKNVRFIDVGVKLNVKASVFPDKKIKMNIRPEVSSFSSWSPADNQPIIETREAETSVIIKDSTTVVIGGLMQEKMVKDIRKIPGVSDIPFIGHLFRKKSTQKMNVELLIFITPRLVATDEPIKPSETAKLGRIKEEISDYKE